MKDDKMTTSKKGRGRAKTKPSVSKEVKAKLQFEMNEEQMDSLNRLLEEFVWFSSRREMLNFAVQFTEWAVDEIKNGRRVGSCSSNGADFSQLLFPKVRSQESSVTQTD
ncbi:hypothetical protein COB55_01335 [Candidatus Wolfebacteria bacterium]|nr:MAG: hypothetical protein COB55_01335 [Candidatus Wolfebacteria bacterium]